MRVVAVNGNKFYRTVDKFKPTLNDHREAQPRGKNDKNARRQRDQNVFGQCHPNDLRSPGQN